MRWLASAIREICFPIIKEHVEEIITVPEKEIVESMLMIWERMKIIVEPSCSITFAAILKIKDEIKGKRVGLILSGGNVDLTKLPWMNSNFNLGKPLVHVEKLKKVITLVGPTASGKTSLAIGLAKRIGGEIISLDSRQIYKGMSIGTAQPSMEEMEDVKHHLVGCLNPTDFISSGRYADLVKKKN